MNIIEDPTEKLRIVVYFAHPIPTYATTQETEVLEAIMRKFPKATIINPAVYPSTDMTFYLSLVQKSDVIVFMTNEEEFIGKGVFDEVQFAQSLKKDVFFYEMQDQQFYRRFKILDINDFNWQNHARVAPLK